jgi:hypothetical protein
MQAIIAAVLSALLAIASSSGAAAGDNKRRHRHTDSYAQKYPTASQRQLRNARAYDRGEYFEQDSNAHPVGSRGWWELKERESGDRLRF